MIFFLFVFPFFVVVFFACDLILDRGRGVSGRKRGEKKGGGGG